MLGVIMLLGCLVIFTALYKFSTPAKYENVPVTGVTVTPDTLDLNYKESD